MKKYCILFLSLMYLLIGPLCAQQNPTYTVGNYKVYTLTDNESDNNPSILIGATPEMLQETMPEGTYPTAIHAYLVKGPEGNILFDTGLGKNLFAQLNALGVNPEDPITIVLTHMHGDHIGGLMKEGQIAFPQAQLYIPLREQDYWTDYSIIATTPSNKQGGFEAAKQVINAYSSQVTVFESFEIDGGSDPIRFLPGVTAISAYGHTPGHTAYLLSSQGEKLLIWGDLTHAMAVQMPYPDVAVTYDVDPETAILYRKKLLQYVVQKNIPVAGMHIPGKGIGKVISNENKGYRFIPVE